MSFLSGRLGGKTKDPGFGENLTGKSRLILKNGRINIRKRGLSTLSLYQSFMEMSWGRFHLIMFGFLVLINLFFASLYVIVGLDQIWGMDYGPGLADQMLKAFYFSIQTYTTVGYGTWAPEGNGAHIIVSVNSLAGWLSFALATGLIFARFSKPNSQVAFSKFAVISDYIPGRQALIFRVANKRNHKMTNLEASVTLSWVDRNTSIPKRQYVPLTLDRSKISMLALSWNIVHFIEESSPLFGITQEKLEEMDPEIIVFLKLYDETYAQEIHSTTSYICSEVKLGHRFKTMYEINDDHTMVYLDRISETEKVG